MSHYRHLVIVPGAPLASYLWHEASKTFDYPLFHVQIAPIHAVWGEDTAASQECSQKIAFADDTCVHLFGFSSVNSRCLHQLIIRPNTFLYFISSSMMFWEDLLSDGELKSQRLPDIDEETLKAL